MAQKTYTLHLAKNDVRDIDDLLSEGARERLAHATTQVFNLADFCRMGRLYVFTGAPKEPSWFREMRIDFHIEGRVTTNSSCALLFFERSERLFAVSFAHGWMHLAEDNFEGDFGLRVAVNAVDELRLKRLERSNLGDAMRGVALSPFQREFKSFGINDALDLVRKISGEARDDSIANSLTGSRSLKYTGECDLNDLPEIADECLASYMSTAYKRTSFAVIDVVFPITDPGILNILDLQMVESIKRNGHEFEIGLPEASGEQCVAYKFQGLNMRRRCPDLLLRNYIEEMGPRLATLDTERLKTDKIVAIYEDENANRSWSIRKGLIGSTTLDGGLYAINEGEWYRLDENFKTSIEDSFQDLIEEWPIAPDPLRKEFDENRNGTYQSEASYNEEVARREEFVLLDRQLFQAPDVRGSAFEICDLLDLQNKRFIHVKKSSRQSSVLSHFFKQGRNAAQQLKIFPAIWDSLKRSVFENYGLAKANRLRDLICDHTSSWTVEFRIADSPRSNGQFNIPFFSKISLCDEVRSLNAMNFNVKIRFIRLEADGV